MASGAAGAFAAAESAGFAGPATVVSAGGAGGGAVSVIVVVVADASVVVASPPPQDAAKRPNERVSALSFTNFIIVDFSWFRTFIPEIKKGNPY